MKRDIFKSRQVIACFFHKLKSQSGETLIYTILVMALLMIISSALIAFAVMSIRIATMQHASEKAFYLSDAAMEETLTQLESSLHVAESKALAKVNDTASYYTESKWQTFLNKINQDTLAGKITAAEAEARLKAATSAEFYKQYYFELYNEPANNTWLKADYPLVDGSGNFVDNPKPSFESSELKKDYFSGLETITLDPSKVKGYEVTPKPLMAVTTALASDVIELTLTSTGQYNEYHKPIVVQVSLVPPDYSQVVHTANGTKVVHKNDLLKYGLAARGDIIVAEGSKNTINGNVYSYGTFPETGTYRISELGGLLMGYRASSNVLTQKIGDFDPSLTTSSADLTVNGSIMTRSGVRLYGDSNLSVSGNTYANSMYFDDASSHADANILRNLYLYEDLFLAGDTPTLKVGQSIQQGDGLFWGIMQQQVNINNQVARSDMSSSIIVHSDAISPRITVNSAYIAGVAYFNVFRDANGSRQYYQSGESFTTNHNFYFYDTKAPGNTALTTSAVLYKDQDDKPYYLDEALNAEGQVVSNVQFKSDVFYQGGLKNPDAISQADRAIMTIRSVDLSATNDLQGLENNYALGVIIANSRVIDPYPNIGSSEAPKSEYATDAVFQGMKRSVLKAADMATSLLSTRDYSTDQNQDPALVTKSRISQFVNWPAQGVANFIDPKAVVIVNPDPNVNVYVNVPDAIADQLKASEPNSIFIREGASYRDMTGLIVSMGNVVVYNNDLANAFKYTGTIVSNKSIVLKGAGEKTFNYSEEAIYGLLVKDSSLNSVFALDSGKKLTLLQVNGADSSSENGSLTFDVTGNSEQLTLPAGQIPASGGMMKKQTEFSFKIKAWSISD